MPASPKTLCRARAVRGCQTMAQAMAPGASSKSAAPPPPPRLQSACAAIASQARATITQFRDLAEFVPVVTAIEKAGLPLAEPDALSLEKVGAMLRGIRLIYFYDAIEGELPHTVEVLVQDLVATLMQLQAVMGQEVGIEG